MSEFFLGLDLGQAADYSALCIAEVLPIATGRTRMATRSVRTGTTPPQWSGDRGLAVYESVEYAVPITEDRYDIRELKRWPLGTSYPAIVESVAALLDREPLASATTTLALDETGVGAPVRDLFQRAELRAHLVPVLITAGFQPVRDGAGWHVPKRDLVSTAQVLLQNRRLKVAPALTEAATLTKELGDYRVKLSDAGRESFNAREGAHDDLILAVALAVWTAEFGRPGEYFAL